MKLVKFYIVVRNAIIGIVRDGREQKIKGPYGLGGYNDKGEYLLTSASNMIWK